jgi:hypothetical protein
MRATRSLIPAAHGYLVDPDAGVVIGLRGRPVGSLDSSGYLQVDGRSRGLGMLSAHRMVWEAVNGPIPDGHEINHISGVKTDNRIANLEAIDHGGNVRHAYRTGLKSNAGERHPSHVLTAADVREIRRQYVRYSRHANARVLAKRFGVERRTIAEVVEGNTWTHIAEEVPA